MSKYFSNSPIKINKNSEIQITNLLFQECKNCNEFSEGLSKKLRDMLEASSRESRREIVKTIRDGCSPLFLAAKKGNVDICEYLVTFCDSNIEQKGLFEVPEERTIHWVTPLWAASVSGKLNVVKYLVRIGANINAVSDSGSTPIRSACYMSNIEIVKFLVENGANLSRANFNGGTCLINSVQSVQLCTYLISKGADINARDIQDKTALHYAIQEHRLETCQLLIENGANSFSKSRYGDDALQTACLKGAHQIFDFLKSRISYTPERLANAHELIGSTFLEEHVNESRVAILHWRLALHIRMRENIPKRLCPPREAFGFHTEFTTMEELDNISTDMDQMRIQSLLICERILGIHHKDLLFRLMFRGASYAESLRYQNCLNLWILSLEVRVQKNSVLHSETCYTAQNIIRLMLNLHDKYLDNLFQDNFHGHQEMPLFKDVYKVFQLLTDNIKEIRNLLQLRPVHRKQQENFDKVLKCITHLIYLMLSTQKTQDDEKLIYSSVVNLMKDDIRSASTDDSLLHLCVSRLNMVKHGFFADNSSPKPVFPNLKVVEFLIKCGFDINARNEARSTPLLIASIPYNYDRMLITLLLDSGSHLDLPNKNDDRPLDLIRNNKSNDIPLLKYTTLKCLAATIITKYRIPYRNQIPKTLEHFLRCHESQV